ncbi:hypothetical protein GCM10010182_47470 [Actinomadura cremea]|nr:hypothetical protein GCM10010182_47470 [Actinomadura cremea]
MTAPTGFAGRRPPGEPGRLTTFGQTAKCSDREHFSGHQDRQARVFTENSKIRGGNPLAPNTNPGRLHGPDRRGDDVPRPRDRPSRRHGHDLSVSFDRLSADRVATVTAKAKSASGVTDAKALVEHRTEEGAAWTSIATVPLTLVDGTANNGTWQARYRTDIEAHPGRTRFLAEFTTSDGGTQKSGEDFIDNCYMVSVLDVTSSPGAVDADTPLTIAGRVLVQKTRDAAPAPAAGVPVWDYTATVRTTSRADGSFSFTHPYRSYLSLEAHSGRDPYDRWCLAGGLAPSPEITKQSVELSAEIVTPQPVKIGDQVTVEGRLLRHGADGLVRSPASGSTSGSPPGVRSR